MAKRKLTLQEHLNHPNYGFRFGLVLKHLEEQYSWDTEEITSEEDVILVITLSLEQNIPPAKIAEQLDAQLKAKEEEEIEPISAPTKGVGMFESDYWEHEMPRAAMKGPWALPPAKGGFLHTPRIESPRSSPHYVPPWQKVRIYAQDLLDKGISRTRKEIAKDLGVSISTVNKAVRGTIGITSGKFAVANPDLPRIEVAENPIQTKQRATKEFLYGSGDQYNPFENIQKAKEEVIKAFLEKMEQREGDQWDVIEELEKEYKIHYSTLIDMLGEYYDKELALEERGAKVSRTFLSKAGTSPEEIEEYLEEFGKDLTDWQISKALGTASDTVKKVRMKLKIKFPEFDIYGRRITARKEVEEE